jgi:signal transduction histidine kinase
MGSGLGLYIVKQIVDGHGGKVSVVSVQGHGSTFRMRFPVRPKAARRASDLNGTRPVVVGMVAS